MKKIILQLVILGLGFYSGVTAQDLKISQQSFTELTKESRSGRYAGTVLKEGKLRVFYLTSTNKEGVQLEQYDFDNTLKFSTVADKFVTDADAYKEFAWYMPRQKVEQIAPDSQKFLKASTAFGSGMKIWLGHMKKFYTLGIYTSMSFIEEKSLKPKTGDIWRIQPSGYKSTSKADAITEDYGFYREFDKYGKTLVAPANAPILAAGVITEKIKLKGPWISNSNRVAILALDGTDFDATKYNIYELPFSAITMGAGLGQDDNLSVLFAPLNAPTNVKSLQKLLWKDKKNHFTMMRFNDNYKLVDSVSFISELLWGSFELFSDGGSSMIFGRGKAAFDGWARNADGIQLKEVEDIQVTKVADGKLIYSKLYSKELLKNKLVTPEGEKLKSNFMAPHNEYFEEMISLANGDLLAMAQLSNGSYALQISPTGDLKAYYRIPRINDKGESQQYNYQIVIHGDILFLVLNEQPNAFTNDTQVNNTLSGRMLTTGVSRINEVFLQSQIVRINTKTLKMSKRLVIDGKDYYTIGSFPAIFRENAIYFTGRNKGPKGKNLVALRIDL